MNIIGHKYIFLSLSALLVLGSFVGIAIWGLKFGIDFTGGSLLEIEYEKSRPSAEDIKKALAGLDLGSTTVQPTEEGGVILRFKDVPESTHQKILQALKDSAGEESALVEKRFDSIGPTVGTELKRRAFLSLGLAVLGIVIYISFAFRKVSQPVSSWKYGVAAILALIHDVIIPIGVFAGLGHYGNVEVDTLFITALLTILGFSVHDTIVVFDRIRENLRNLKQAEPYEITIGRSIKETVARSINTSLTVLAVLFAIFFWGGETTRFFSLALILGITFGTYSSIFVASPLLVVWNSLIKRDKSVRWR